MFDTQSNGHLLRTKTDNNGCRPSPRAERNARIGKGVENSKANRRGARWGGDQDLSHRINRRA